MSYTSFRSGAFMRAALFIAVSVCIAKGDTITASLFSPTAPSGALTLIDVSSVTPPSDSTLTDPGLYTITFATPAGEGIVKGKTGGHAIPVAGVSGTNVQYLTGGFGSPLTPPIGGTMGDMAAAGNYLSTGVGTITITFDKPQDALALLWGSIDATGKKGTGNSVELNDASSFTVTGAEVQTAAAGFVSNGFQGPGGSAYVIIDTSTPFTTATFTSGVVSFEFAGVAGSNVPFNTGVPEPGSVLLLGTGLLLLCGSLRLRRS